MVVKLKERIYNEEKNDIIFTGTFSTLIKFHNYFKDEVTVLFSIFTSVDIGFNMVCIRVCVSFGCKCYNSDNTS